MNCVSDLVGGRSYNRLTLELDVAVDDIVVVQIADSSYQLSKHALHHCRLQDIAVFAGQLKQVTTRTVAQDQQSAFVGILERLELYYRGM